MDATRLTQLSRQYDLDGGGYSFTEPPEAFKGLGVAMWDGPDPDYVPWLYDACGGSHGFHGLSCPVYMFAPNSGHFSPTVWPKAFKDVAGDTFVLKGEGHLHESDHECNCHGNFETWTGAAGEPNTPIPEDQILNWISTGKLSLRDVQTTRPFTPKFWECTGTPSDKPYPDCPRCGGEGRLTVEGGEWALYALEVKDDD